MIVSGKIGRGQNAGCVMGTAYLSIDVLDGLVAFLRVVESDGRAGLVERKNGTAYEFLFDGGPSAAADLLSRGSCGPRGPRGVVRPGSRRGARGPSSPQGRAPKEVS